MRSMSNNDDDNTVDDIKPCNLLKLWVIETNHYELVRVHFDESQTSVLLL